MLFIFRLLVQLEETERTFDLFWTHHSSRLRHCLALRQFEADFRELQAILDQHLKTIEEMTEVGETQARVEQLLCDTSAFQRICRVCIYLHTYIYLCGGVVCVWMWVGVYGWMGGCVCVRACVRIYVCVSV